MIYSPAANYFGEDNLTFRVYDGTEYSVTALVSIEINSVNDAPVLGSIGAQSTSEDTSLTILLSAEDVDDIDLVFSVSSNNNAVTVSIDEDQLTMTPDADWNGTANITVTVSDGEFEDSEEFYLLLYR